MNCAAAGATIAALVLLAGCGTGDREPLGQAMQAYTSVCGATEAVSTFDGYPAFKYCGDFDVYSNDGKHTSSTPQTGWVKTETGYGYQCVELAVRYFHFRWGVKTAWGVMGAKDMCGTHPSGVTQTTSPVPGDLMVFGAGSCGADATFGHVGVVDAVSGTKITLVQQNFAARYDYQKSCASCFLHAAANGATADPCATAADGFYCGESTQWSGGTAGDLYQCLNGATAAKTPCAYGCHTAPAGTADACNAAPGAGGASGWTDAGSAGGAAGGAGSPGAGGGWQNASGGAAGGSGSGWVTDDAGAPAPDGGTAQRASAGSDAGCNAGMARPPRTPLLMLLALVGLLGLRRRSP